MIRTLVVCPKLPFPMRSGPDMRAWQSVNALLRLGPVAVFGVKSEPPSAPPVENITLWRSGSDDRVLATGSIADLSWMADPDGLPSDPYYSDVVDADLADAVESFRPEIVVLEGIFLSRYLPVISAAADVIVLSAHNVETVLHRQIAVAQRDPRAGLLYTEFARRVARLEEAIVSEVDQIWACSPEDARLFHNLWSDGAPAHVVPNGVDVETANAVAAADYGDHAVIYTGQFSYAPNQVAARCLIDEVYPPLAQTFPDTRLLLVGRFPTSEMEAAAGAEPGIVVTGSVPDTRSYLAAASVMATPLFQGGGTRFKILEAFAAGVPVVTTPKGIEGIDAVNGVHALLAEDAGGIGDGVMRLWREPGVGERLAANAFDLVREHYSWDAVAAAVAAAVGELPAAATPGAGNAW